MEFKKDLTFAEREKWIISQHEVLNHQYDKYLPYEFHLRMVLKAAKEYIVLLRKNGNITDINDYSTIFLAALGHDLLEDTHVSYNDIKKVLGVKVAEIIYALTNEKGRTRKERANDKYYEGIRNTEGAVFVKLCDRIANVRYGKITGSQMVKMYQKENPEFIKKLGYREGHHLHEMFDALNQLFIKEN